MKGEFNEASSFVAGEGNLRSTHQEDRALDVDHSPRERQQLPQEHKHIRRQLIIPMPSDQLRGVSTRKIVDVRRLAELVKEEWAWKIVQVGRWNIAAQGETLRDGLQSAFSKTVRRGMTTRQR